MAKERGFSATLFLICVMFFIISPSGGEEEEEKKATHVQLLRFKQKAEESPSNLPIHDSLSPRSHKEEQAKPTPSLASNNATTWCVVKPSTPPEKLDEIIQYCCTQISVNCSVIQSGGVCYYPFNKVSDAAVVMNMYYRVSGRNVFDCDFKGSGLIVDNDPSVGNCTY